DDLPDWLDDTQASDAPSEEPAPTGDLPEWLQGADSDEPPADTATDDDEPPTTGALPDWLQDIEPEPPATEEPAPIGDDSPRDLPDWLQGAEPEDEDELEDLFGEDAHTIDSLLFGDDDDEASDEPQPAATFDVRFDEDDFGDVDDAPDDFDLLVQMSQTEGDKLDDLLPEDDEFDLLAELSDDDGDEFDLLGELNQTDEPPASDLPAVEKADDDEFDFLDNDADSQEVDEFADELDRLLAAADAEAATSAAPDPEPFDDDTFGPASFAEDDELAPGDAPPDWFTQAAAPAEPETEPDWLDDLPEAPDEITGEQPTMDAETSETAAPRAVDDLDAYLASLGGQGALTLPEEHDLTVYGDDIDLDALFNEVKQDSEPSQPKERPDVELSPDAPEWLADMSKMSTGEQSAAAIVRRRPDRPMDELPESLRALHERGLQLPGDRTDVTPGTPALEGVSGTLPPVIFEPGPASVMAALELSEDQQARVDLLRSLAGSASTTDAVPDRPAQRRRVPLERIVIAVLLLLAMLLPFGGWLQFGALPPNTFANDSRQATFYAAVDALNPGDRLLLAVEYGPTGAAELDETAIAVLRHAIGRGALPVIVGGNPVGLLHAHNIAGEVAAANDLERGRHYVVGRYLVGDAVGLRNFGDNIERLTTTDLFGEPTGLDLRALDDFALVVVIAERADRLRAWAEQVAPLLAVTGAGAAPLSEPYITAGDTAAGMLVGYRDGYTYNQMLDRQMGLFVPTATTTPTETPTPTQTPTPTETLTATVTNTLEPGALPPPTSTPAPTDIPTDTATPEPSETPLPTATPTDTATPTATATSTLTPTPTPEPVTLGTVIADTRVNVRSGPSTNAGAVASLGPGEQVIVLGTNDDESWFEIVLPDGGTGWVAAFLIETQIITDPATLTPQPEARRADTLSRLIPAASDKLRQDEPELMPEVTAEPGELVAVVAPPRERQDERWYSMTAGIVIIVLVIAIGNVISLLRALSRRRNR
ncbi:MAG: SH3 domain-containing protein, partial [Phototrophicaceae bacterium]